MFKKKITNCEKRKIVIGINDLCVGGAQNQLIQLLKHFYSDAYEVHVVTLFECDKRVDLGGDMPEFVSVHHVHFKSFVHVMGWIALFRLLRRLNPNIIMSSLFFSNTVFRVVAIFLRCPVVAREHNTYVDKKKIHQCVDRCLAQFSRLIVAVSSGVKEFTVQQERIPENKFVVIRNGVAVEEVLRHITNLPNKETVRSDLGIKSDKRLLLNIARLTAQKNHKLLIKSFAKLQAHNPAYILAVVGDGEIREELEDLARREGVKEQVIFFGTQRPVWHFYKACDVFVSMSSIEGLSNTYLEALAAGVPLVVTKTAGTDELIRDGKNGFFIIPTPDDFLEKIERVFEQDLESLRVHAQAFARLFDIKETAAAYKSLLNRKIIECVGMQGSGKTFLSNQVAESGIALTIPTPHRWTYHACLFMLANLKLSVWWIYTAAVESIRVGSVQLLLHKLYMFSIKGARYRYAHRTNLAQHVILDESFVQGVLSLYERKLTVDEFRKVLKKIPSSDLVLFLEKKDTDKHCLSESKVSRHRSGVGGGYVEKWREVFAHNSAVARVVMGEEMCIMQSTLSKEESLINITRIKSLLFP